MAWQRRGTGLVYYRSQRDGEQVRRFFVGRGAVGEAAERLDRCLRRERARRQAALRRITQSLQQLSRQQWAADQAGMIRLRAHLVVDGFYQHHRSEWRRREMKRATPPAANTIRFPTAPANSNDWQKLVEQANAGDAAALGRVRELLRTQPAIVTAAVDLETTCRNLALDLVCASDAVLRETLILKFDAFEADLVGPTPSPAVRLAARRVALAWLTLQVADLHCAEQSKLGPVPKRWQDHRDLSERRYLTALKLIETIRGLTPPRRKPG